MLSGSVLKQFRTYLKSQVGHGWSVEGRKSKDGDIKYKNEDYKGAIIDYSEILKNNPENKYALFRRALSKSKIKDYEGAISDYSKVIEIDKTYHQAFYRIHFL